MKRTGTGKPYLSFSLIIRNAAETLEACLKSIRARAPDAEIVIVDTCSNDIDESGVPRSHTIAQRYADVWEEWTGPRGTWNREMLAFDDAAAARNHSFALASGTWICWIDADDELPGPEEAERLLKINARWQPVSEAQRAKGPNDDAAGPVALEDFLHFIEAKHPDIQGFRCPYLYRSNPDGTAFTWQERERIIKKSAAWHWRRPAHEILVPKNEADFTKMANLSHFLFVHKKKFTADDAMFSLKRHYAILIKEYESGERNFQGLLYLENFSIWLCPQRRLEFINAAYEVAASKFDRARVLVRVGNFATENGLYMDAIEAYTAAAEMAPNFPDVWIAGANMYVQSCQPLKAAEWFYKGSLCPADCVVSDVTPRVLRVEVPAHAAEQFLKGSFELVRSGRTDDAIDVLKQGHKIMQGLIDHPAIGDDRITAIHFMNLLDNQARSLEQMKAAFSLWQYLIDNDETQKALQLIDILPHNVKDHPSAITMEQWAVKMRQHLIDPAAYQQFYSEVGTDITSCESGMTYDEAMPRARFLVDWLKENKPNAKMLEIGCLPEGKVIMGDLTPREICDVRVGDVVLGMTGQTEVKQRFERHFEGELVCIRVRGYQKPIRMTPNHPLPISVFGLRGNPYSETAKDQRRLSAGFQWFRADAAQEHDLIVLSRSFAFQALQEDRLDLMEVLQQVEFIDYDETEVFALQRLHNGLLGRAHRQNPVSRFVALTADLGRLFGYYISEGSSSGRGSHGQCTSGLSLTFNGAEEKEYIADTQSLLKSLFNLESRTKSTPGNLAVHVIANSGVVHTFFELSVGRGAENKRIPAWAFANRVVLAGILQGMFRGDGSHIIDDCMKFDTVSETLAYQIKYALHIFGIPSSLVTDPKLRTNVIKSTGQVVQGRHHAHSIRVYGQRARAKLAELISEPPIYVSEDSQDRWLIDDSRMLVRIEKIWREPYSGPVYNLETGDNTFTVGAINVHNSFDGVTGMPVLTSLPEVQYVAVDAKQDALDRFMVRAKRLGVADRLTTIQGLDSADFAGKLERMSFDVVVFHEVIEHVPKPVDSIHDLLQWLKPDGVLFVSTPWGAFDRGHFITLPRDPRGHVRAMMPRDLVNVFDEAGAHVLELRGYHDPANYGDTIHTISERAYTHRRYGRPTTFFVPSALWDWNATHVEKTGIGASEETIVGLARYLSKQKGRSAEVYGPLPKHSALTLEEVRDGVRYWPREQARLINPESIVVVSRTPGYGKILDDVTQKKLDKILWLQDAWYPDLNPTTAADYKSIVVLSEWHAQAMRTNHGVPSEKLVVIPNFLEASQFEKVLTDSAPAREPHKFVYMSSPDRGLINLLKIWPKILEVYPKATLHIFYGWEGCMKLGAFGDPSWTVRYRAIRKQYLELRGQPGIVERGRVNHVTIANELLNSSAWLYPSSFDETFCSNSIKARAAGCIPVCTPRAALLESAACPETRFVPMPASMDPISNGIGVERHPEWNDYCERFVAAVREAVETSEEARRAMAQVSIDKYRLEAVFPKWERILGYESPEWERVFQEAAGK